MFRVVLPPIIKRPDNCIYSIWYLSHRYWYLPLSWKIWNGFECAVGGIYICMYIFCRYRLSHAYKVYFEIKAWLSALNTSTDISFPARWLRKPKVWVPSNSLLLIYQFAVGWVRPSMQWRSPWKNVALAYENSWMEPSACGGLPIPRCGVVGSTAIKAGVNTLATLLGVKFSPLLLAMEQASNRLYKMYTLSRRGWVANWRERAFEMLF
jgi:hypothetical protein